MYKTFSEWLDEVVRLATERGSYEEYIEYLRGLIDDVNCIQCWQEGVSPDEWLEEEIAINAEEQ